MSFLRKERVIFELQKIILYLSFLYAKVRFKPKSNSCTWVVGTSEVAGLTSMLAKAVPGSYSVALDKHVLYKEFYNFERSRSSNHIVDRLLLYFQGPALLGQLVVRSSGFIYVGKLGFLISEIDFREYEFRFLKKHHKKIFCYFIGSEIRSPALMLQASKFDNEENWATYALWLDPNYSKSEFIVQNIARVANKYADGSMNARYDQASHLKNNVYPIMYFYPMESLEFQENKFVGMNQRKIRILHAPTSPLLKGTQVIRTVIRMLQNEGYQFEYTELFKVPNGEVLRHLQESHIVINELYAFMPGVFAIEAMAMSCVVLTRADATFETQLPSTSNAAWIVTPAYSLYANLKKLLDNPTLLEGQARKGFDWVRTHASLESSGPQFIEILNNL